MTEGEAITPVARARVQDGKFYVPDCADYNSKFGLPARIKIKEVYAGWSCFNCEHLLESSTPFAGPHHKSFNAQGPAVGAGRPVVDPKNASEAAKSS